MCFTDDILIRNKHIVEEDLTEAGVTAELFDRPHCDPVGMQVEHQVGQSPVALPLGVGSEQPEAPLPERRSAAPDLLAVEKPATFGAGGGGPQ